MIRTWCSYFSMYVLSVFALLNKPLESGVCVFFLIMSPKTDNAWVGVGNSFVSDLLNTTYARHFSRADINSLDSHGNLTRQVIVLSFPFFRWENEAQKVQLTEGHEARAGIWTRVVLWVCDHLLYHIHRLGGVELKSSEEVIGPLAGKACKFTPGTSREARRESWKPPMCSKVTHGGKRGSWFREGWHVSETSTNTQRIYQGSENTLQCTIMMATCHIPLSKPQNGLWVPAMSAQAHRL